ncbi:MAG: hypothetical protein JWM76_1645 [Pseudonocardiales bacterium]|nr:hypothetical protein [Pseudonocardiales bacterium]
MVFALPGEGRFAAPVQALARALSRNPSASEAFNCGVRVAAGAVEGEARYWRYRASFVEPQREKDVTVLHHGDQVLRLRLTGTAKSHRLRPGYVRLTALLIDSDVGISLSCRPEMVHRLKGLG